VTGYLLDTNVISELSKQKPEPRVTAFIGANPLDNLYLSEITLAEIRFGIEKLSDALKRSAITSWLDHVLRPMFQAVFCPSLKMSFFAGGSWSRRAGNESIPTPSRISSSPPLPHCTVLPSSPEIPATLRLRVLPYSTHGSLRPPSKKVRRRPRYDPGILFPGKR